MAVNQHPSSYRDPSGYIFTEGGILYRRVNESFVEQFKLLHSSGLYDELTGKGLLLKHERVELQNEFATGGITIQPERVPFITYPYEWSFGMLKDASLLTLRIMKIALEKGMVLKDATPFNIQWHEGKLCFIDTLSFEKYEEKPWIAYRQFCECFLGPLVIMHYSKRQMPGLMLAWPNGIPIDIVASMVPKKTKFSIFTYLHIHLNAKYARKGPGTTKKADHLPKKKLENLIGSLEILINKLSLPEHDSTWSHYYDEASEREDYLSKKKELVRKWVDELAEVKTAIDFGANEGEFSLLLAERRIRTVAADFDPYCIDRLYNKIKEGGEKLVQPMTLDLSNPTPAIGVNHAERDSFLHRAKFDLALALALLHHLAIGKNIPFRMIAEFFSQTAPNLIIEFIPKTDEKIKLMLSEKEDIYSEYSEEEFEKAFGKYYRLSRKELIGNSGRLLYLFQECK